MGLLIRRPAKAERPEFRVTAGAGVLATQVGDQVALRSNARGRRFQGSWRCSIVGDGELVVRQGFVNGLEPMIGDKFISGIDAKNEPYKDGAPFLRLKTGLFDDTGRSWICIRVLVDANGKMKEKDYKADDLSIVQVDRRFSSDDLIGLQVIAVLRRGEGDSDFGTLRQIAWFDYQHMVSKDQAGKQSHFFVPA